MNEEFKARLTEHILGEYTSPLPYYLGVSMVDLEDGRATLALTASRATLNGYKILHGGALMTLADCAMGAACFTYHKQVVTIDANISYLKPSPMGTRLTCAAVVRHNGKRTMVVDCDIKDAQGTLRATAHGTFFVIGEFN